MDELGSIILGSQPSDQEKGKAASNKDQFVATYTPAAQKVAQQLNVPVDAVLGHWGHETNWGKSVVPGTNNLGNIKDFSGKGVTAIDNQTKTKDKYKQYATPEEFADDYANLVANRYKSAIDTKTPYDYANALQQGGYAQDKNFANAVSASSKNVFASSDPLGDIILNPSEAKPTALQASQQPRQSKVAEIGRAIMRGGVFQPEVIKEAATAIPTAVREKLFGQPAEEQQATEPFIKTLGKSAAGFVDTAAGVVPAIAGGLTYAGARFLGQTPEQAAEYQQKVVSATDKPLGKAFGITEESAYKNEATTRLMNFIGENMDKGADWISAKTGLPKNDVLSIMESGSFAVPSLAGKTAGFVKGKVGPTISEWGQEFRRTQAGERPAVAPQQPAAGQPQPTVVQPGQPPKPAAPFEVPVENPPPPTQPLSSADVNSRAETLRKVGIETARRSALENNPKEASAQYITSKASQEPYGQGITEQINHEKSALDTHFSKIEQEAGGTTVRYGTPEEVGDRISAGKKIKEGLEAGQKEWKAEADRLYKEAESAHGETPINTENFNNFLNEESNFAYENEAGLQRGIKGYLKKKGLLDENGSVRPMTVAEAEGVRKYINSKYHHETKGLSRQLKASLDEDVFGSVGGETYEKARRHWQKGVETYDNPKGVGDLLSDEGVNQKIADEKVMDKVSALNQSQFDHLLNTLRDDKQTSAVQQIQTSLVNQIKRAGQSAVNEPWNSVRAAKEAAALGKKLESAFADNPKALQQIYDGINAGNILHIPTNYPGAAVQTHLLKNKFIEMGVQKLGTGAGATIGSIFGPMGAAAGGVGGEVLGANVAGRMRGARQAKQVQQELTPLNQVGKK